jgi:hypothetical protein
MNHKETLKLVRRFPVLYQDFYSPMSQTCMCWGFDHGEGWKDIIWQLSLAIEDELKYTKFQCFMFLFKKRLAKYWNRFIYRLSPAREHDFVARMFRALKHDSMMDAESYYTPKTYLLGMSWARLEMGIKMLIWFPDTGFAVTQVKEKYGTLRFYCGCSDRIDHLVNLAERASSLTCEECGEAGQIRGQSWLYTACSAHSHDEDLDPEVYQDSEEIKARELKKVVKYSPQEF